MNRIEDDFNFDAIKEGLEKLSTPAARGDNPPSSLTVLERGYYDTLAGIYKAHASGEMTVEQAKSEKNKLQHRYFDEYKGNIDGFAAYAKMQENIRYSEMAMTDIIKNITDIKQIALLACRVISEMTGDKPFDKLSKEKIEKLG